jgi:hypothetical protein
MGKADLSPSFASLISIEQVPVLNTLNVNVAKEVLPVKPLYGSFAE